MWRTFEQSRVRQAWMWMHLLTVFVFCIHFIYLMKDVFKEGSHLWLSWTTLSNIRKQFIFYLDGDLLVFSWTLSLHSSSQTLSVWNFDSSTIRSTINNQYSLYYHCWSDFNKILHIRYKMFFPRRGFGKEHVGKKRTFLSGFKLYLDLPLQTIDLHSEALKYITL